MFVAPDDDRLSPRRGEMFVAPADDRLSPRRGEMRRAAFELFDRTFDPYGVGAVPQILQTLNPYGVRSKLK